MISNSAPSPSTLTLSSPTYDPAAPPMGAFLNGNLALVKNGDGFLRLTNGGSTFTGNVTVNGGYLTASAPSDGSNGTLGRVDLAGRTITVNNSSSPLVFEGTRLLFESPNIFGTGINNANLPSIVLNRATLLESSQYNVLGPVTLNNASIETSQFASGEGLQFKGPVTVGGSGASAIGFAGSLGFHLDTNTVFDVGDATSSSAVDLFVSERLRDQSGDFGLAAGGLTKTGAGTMELRAANTYTGMTVINAGTLHMYNDGFGREGTIGGPTRVNAGGTLAGRGSVGPVNVVGGTLSPGGVDSSSGNFGTLKTGSLTLDSNSFLKFELGFSNDLISVNGDLTLDGTLQVIVLPYITNRVYRLFNYTGVLTNNTLNLEPSFLLAYPGSSIDTGTYGQVNLVMPEPGALISMVGGVGMLFGLRRLRRTA
jgi:fibronectin-binding autotransporter adhesin